LPAASFRFHLAVDTLAVRLTVPPVGSVEDLHLQVNAPCRAHQKLNGRVIDDPAFECLINKILSEILSFEADKSG
jgi:hypothetical protein